MSSPPRSFAQLAPTIAIALACATSVRAQSHRVPFPFVVSSADAQTGELVLTPRTDEIARLSQLTQVRMSGVRLTNGAVIELELAQIDVEHLQLGVSVDGAPATEVLEELELSLWTTSERGGDEAMLSFSQYGCRGWIRHAGQLHHLMPLLDETGDWSRARARLIDEGALARCGFAPGASCARDVLPGAAIRAPVGSQLGLAPPPPVSLYHARVALETDYQLYTLFGSVPAEVAYLTTIYGWVSRRFEEQVGVVLTYPYLQIYTTPADPWATPETPGLNCIDMLYEFQAAWQGSIPASADLGHFVSGVHLGCAVGFRPGVCNAPDNFSVMSAVNGTTPFPIQPGPANWDFVWMCHELGHNFDAIHSHDYCPPLDRCPPASAFGPCQTQQVCTNQGTLMSYCHACAGGMSNFTTWFHDQSAADMRAWVTSASCLPLYCGDPVVYCVAKVNSLGCLPSASYSGHPTLTGLDDFAVRADGVLNNKNGVYFYGSAPSNAPFQGGTLCVAPPLQRTPLQGSAGNPAPDDCSGAFSYAWTHQRLSAVGSGATLYSQFWSRDPASASTTGLTDAVSFTICN